MRRFSALSVCLVLALAFAQPGTQAQTDPPDNKGTEFVVGFAQNLTTANIRIYLAAELTTTVEVSGPQVATTTHTVPAGGIVSVALTDAHTVKTNNLATNQGIRIRVVGSDRAIAVYGLNQSNATTDAYMALPTDVLGTEYRVAAHKAVGGRPSQVLLVANEDGTQVTVTTSANAVGFTRNIPRTIVLNRLQTFLIEAPNQTDDLTGSLVTSSKPLAVFGGAQCGNVPDAGTVACDHMVEQLTPTSTWAKEFIVTPLATRTAGDIVRVVAHESGTEVRINGNLVTVLVAGTFFEFTSPSNAATRILTSKPAQVMQYSKGSSADGVTSDPFMLTVAPISQWGNNYFFSTPPASPIAFSNWVNVVIKDADKFGLSLDGIPISPTWRTIPGTPYVFAQLQSSIGVHRLQHASPIVSFGVSVYGWASFDSYGYPGGMRLAPLHEACSVTTPVAGDGLDNDCDDKIDEEIGNGIDDDGDGLIDEDLAVPPPNSPPIANAGANFTVPVGPTCRGTFALSGSASTDPDGHLPLQYVWSSPLFGTASGESILVPPLPPGAYTFTLVVVDALGVSSAPHSVTATVVDLTPPVIFAMAPVVVTATSAAGATVTLPVEPAADNCGNVPALPAVASGTFALGDTAVTYNAVDTAGNTAVATRIVRVVPPPLNVSSITSETRRWTGPAPTDGTEAEGIYFAQPLGEPGYAPGPKTLTTFSEVSNQSIFGGSITDIAYYHHVAFTAPIDGSVTVRVGGDFGGGGTLVVDGQIVDFRSTDLWWDGSFDDSAQHLAATLNITAGPHVIDVYGFEDAGDGAQQAEYSYLGGPFTVFTAPANEVPELTLHGPATAAPGSTHTFMFSVSDPDPGASFTVSTLHCGANGMLAGTPVVAATGGSFDCTFANAIATSLVSLRVTDNLGAPSALATRPVALADNGAPLLALPGNATLEAVSAAGAPFTFTATATDDFDPDALVACSHASGVFPIGTTTVSCTATDDTGNQSSGSFTVTVQDTTAPSLTLPADAILEAVDALGAPFTFTAAATDAVDADVTIVCSHGSGVFAIGTTAVSCTATDDHSNSSTAGFNVVVRDTTAPVVVFQETIIVEAVNATGAEVAFDVRFADGVDGLRPAACSPASPSTFPLGSTAVTCTATDAAGNAAEPMTFDVIVRDTTAPALNVPSNTTIEAVNAGGAPFTFNATATDAVDATVTITCSRESGIFALGATTVSCSATDDAGNESSASFTVTVHDSTPPVLVVPVTPVIVEASSPAGGSATFTVSANDTVDGTIGPSCSVVSGATFALGDTTVSCHAADQAGNTASAEFLVVVRDTTPPVVTGPNVIVEATGPAGALANYSVTANDLVGGVLPVTCSHAGLFPLGATVVSCTATDAAGNTGSGSLTVSVVDTTGPVMTGADVSVVSPGPSGVSVALPVTANDAVSGPATVTCAPASGSIFPIGSTPVTCSATDAAGNTSSIDVNVTVAPAAGCFIVDFREITYFKATKVITSSDAGIRAANRIAGPFDPSLWPYRASGNQGQSTRSKGTLFRIYGFAPSQLGSLVRNADNPAITYVVQRDADNGDAYYIDLGGPARVSICPDQLHEYVLAGEKGNGHRGSSSTLPAAQRNVPGLMLTQNSQIVKLPKHVKREMEELDLEHGDYGLIDYIGFQLQGDGNASFREFVDVEISFPFDSETDGLQHFRAGFHTATNTNFETFAGCSYMDASPGNDSVRFRDVWAPNKGSLGSGAWRACGRREPSQNERVRANYDVPYNAIQLLPTVSGGSDTTRLFFGPIREVSERDRRRSDSRREWRDWDDWDDWRDRNDRDGRRRR